MNATNSERKTKKEGKGDSNQTKLKLGIQTQEEASRGLNAQNETGAGPIPDYSPISQEEKKNSKKRGKTKQNRTRFVVVV